MLAKLSLFIRTRRIANELTSDRLDRLRLRIKRRFQSQLRNISGSPDTDDLLHDAVEDILNGRRKWPSHVSLPACLFQIVKSKVSHEQEKWKTKLRENRGTELIREQPTNISGQVIGSSDSYSLAKVGDSDTEHLLIKNNESDLGEKILSCVADDPFLKKLVEYQLNHSDESVKPQKIANALGVEVKEIYNANKRLKRRLAKLYYDMKKNYN